MVRGRVIKMQEKCQKKNQSSPGNISTMHPQLGSYNSGVLPVSPHEVGPSLDVDSQPPTVVSARQIVMLLNVASLGESQIETRSILNEYGCLTVLKPPTAAVQAPCLTSQHEEVPSPEQTEVTVLAQRTNHWRLRRHMLQEALIEIVAPSSTTLDPAGLFQEVPYRRVSLSLVAPFP